MHVHSNLFRHINRFLEFLKIRLPVLVSFSYEQHFIGRIILMVACHLGVFSSSWSLAYCVIHRDHYPKAFMSKMDYYSCSEYKSHWMSSGTSFDRLLGVLNLIPTPSFDKRSFKLTFWQTFEFLFHSFILWDLYVSFMLRKMSIFFQTTGCFPTSLPLIKRRVWQV